MERRAIRAVLRGSSIWNRRNRMPTYGIPEFYTGRDNPTIVEHFTEETSQ